MADEKDTKKTSERTYLGPATTFRESAGARPVRPGEKVSLTAAQYEQLSGMGHSFDPPWNPGDERPAPDEVEDIVTAEDARK